MFPLRRKYLAAVMGSVFTDIDNRLKQFSIDIYHDSGKSPLTEESTTLEGIEFVAQNKTVGRGKPVVGINDLKNALAQARKSEKRAFAGQILSEDRNNVIGLRKRPCPHYRTVFCSHYLWSNRL